MASDKPSLIVRLASDTIRTREGWQVEFRQLVEEVTEESNVFSSVAINPGEGRVADYTVELHLRVQEGEIGFLGILLFDSSLGAIPAITTDRLEMTGKVVDGTGRELKTYVLQDSMMKVTHPLGLLVYWFAPGPEAVASRIVENMLRTLYQRALNDGLLRQY